MADRYVVLDTETTGLEPADGHRVIEIGCIEVINRRVTGNHFHVYLKPDRKVDPEAFGVHGISDEFLADKPVFADVFAEFVDFIQGAELIIHNAPFDVGFLDAEFARLAREQGDDNPQRTGDICGVTDSLLMARKLHPGQRNSLDALCSRYGIDNSNRELHGALLDSEILADVWLAMTGGQIDLALSAEQDEGHDASAQHFVRGDLSFRVLQASPEEAQSHADWLDKMGDNCAWAKMDAAEPQPKTADWPGT